MLLKIESEKNSFENGIDDTAKAKKVKRALKTQSIVLLARKNHIESISLYTHNIRYSVHLYRHRGKKIPLISLRYCCCIFTLMCLLIDEATFTNTNFVSKKHPTSKSTHTHTIGDCLEVSLFSHLSAFRSLFCIVVFCKRRNQQILLLLSARGCRCCSVMGRCSKGLCVCVCACLCAVSVCMLVS